MSFVCSCARLARILPRVAGLGLILAVVGSVCVQADPRTGGWAQDRSSLKPDPSVIWGQLDNGFRYAVLPHDGVPGRVSIQLLVLAGSLDERSSEQGLAHFIEHMAFNGTRNFQASEMNSFFQHLGMDFGSDVNAMTTFDHTVYELEFQENTDDLLRRGMTLFRDFADGIEFSQEEIDKERGVVLSELRGHDGFEFRTQNAATRFFFKGLTLPERIPIGKVEILNTANRADFKGYYERNYRPDLMFLVASGDFDPAWMVGMVGEFFGSMAKPTTGIPDRPMGRLSNGRGLRASVFEISHVGSASVQVASIEEDKTRSDSLAVRRQWHERELAAALLGNRLRRMIPGTGGSGASVMKMGGYNATMAGLSAPGGEGWRNGLLSLDQVIRLTHEDGFQAKEADWMRKRGILDLEKMRAQAEKLDPAVVSRALVESIVNDQVFIGLGAELALEESYLRDLNIGDINRAFRESWAMDSLAYHLSGEVTVKGGPDEIVDDLNRHRRGGISYVSMTPEQFKEFELQDWGPVGEMVERQEVPEFGASLMSFSNGVRFNFIESDKEPALIRAVVRVGGGLFDLKGNRKAIRDFALKTVLRSGTAHYMADDIGSLLNGSMLEFSFDLDQHDAFTFRGTFGIEDLDTFLGIVTEFLYNPKFSRTVFNGELMGAMQARQSAALGLQDGFRKLDNHLYRTDARFVWGGPMDYATLAVSDVRKWMDEPLSKGYVEASMVGDIPEQLAVEAVARTLGSLPQRADKKKTRVVRPVTVAARPEFQRVEFVGEAYQAAAVGIWPIEEKLSFEEKVNLSVLSKILEVRIRNEVRENLGLAYAPQAEFKKFPEYKKFALVRAMVDCSPDEAESIAHTIERIATNLAVEGVSEEEFAGAVEPFVGHVRQALVTNQFLLQSVLMRAQEKPETVEEAIALKAGLDDVIALEEVERLGKLVLAEENTRTVAIVPKPFVGVFQIEEGGSAGEAVIGRP